MIDVVALAIGPEQRRFTGITADTNRRNTDMLTKRIRGWNAAPGAPPNWDPAKDGDCGILPIRVVPPAALERGRAHLLQYVESAWEPTPDELAMLNAGGSVVLRVVGWQVPVALYVEPPASAEGEG